MSEENTPAVTDDQKPSDKRGGEPAAMMGIPVSVQVVLGTAKMPVSQLLALGRGAVIELDRKAGDPVDVTVNGRVVARGEIVLLADQRIGVTLTEIVHNGSGS